MNQMTKWAIGLGAVSFAVTLWVLRSGPAAAPKSEVAPPPAAAHEAPRDVPTSFATAILAAAQVGSTPEGLKYQDEAAPVLSNLLQDRLSACLAGASPLDQAAFAVAVGVAPNGTVTSTWASPETPLASCVLRRLAGATLPPPRISDVWMAANIRPDTLTPEAEPEH